MMDFKIQNVKMIYLIIFSVIAVIITLLVIYWNYEGGIKEKEIYKIVDTNWSIDGVIIEKKTSNHINNRGTLIMTSDNQRFIFPWARNFNYKRSMLSELVQEGDSIVKNKDSDSIYIYRGDEKFYFILKARIQKDEQLLN